MSQSYQNMFGSFVTKYQLGGMIQGKMGISDVTGIGASDHTKKLGEIERSRSSRDHFFTQKKQEELRDRIDNMSEDEKARIDVEVLDSDMVSWFNRTRVST